jgi:hypothetical protein
MRVSLQGRPGAEAIPPLIGMLLAAALVFAPPAQSDRDQLPAPYVAQPQSAAEKAEADVRWLSQPADLAPESWAFR